MIIIASLTSDEQCVDLLFVIYSNVLLTYTGKSRRTRISAEAAHLLREEWSA